jgi:hypothetical protein
MLNPLPCVCALEEEHTDFCKNLVISQEKYQVGSILISRPHPVDEKMRDLIIFNNIKTLDDYIVWLETNIKYKKDEGQDNWSEPQETLQKKYGDCEDFAFLNAAFLRVAGFQPKVLGVMRHLGGNHAICVFKENGYYSWIDNNQLERTQAVSILQFAEYIFAKYGCASLRELKLKTRGYDIVYLPKANHQ